MNLQTPFIVGTESVMDVSYLLKKVIYMLRLPKILSCPQKKKGGGGVRVKKIMLKNRSVYYQIPLNQREVKSTVQIKLSPVIGLNVLSSGNYVQQSLYIHILLYVNMTDLVSLCYKRFSICHLFTYNHIQLYIFTIEIHQ